ncbi:toxin glutamine deamidase domain-containing protein [Sphingomonas sp. UYAg733]
MIGMGKAAEYIAGHNKDFDPAMAAVQVAEEHGYNKEALLRFADFMEAKIRSDNPAYQAEVDRQVRAIRGHANELEDPSVGFRIPPNPAVAQLAYFADQMRNGSLAEPSVSAAPPDDRSPLHRYLDTAMQDARISARESRQRLGHGLLQDTPEARAQMANNPGVQAAMLALDALTAPERGFISGLFRPLFPESDDIYLTRAIEANNAEHPWLIDPRHLRTPQEKRDLAADVTMAALTAKVPMGGAGRRLGSAADHIYTDMRRFDAEFPELLGVNPHYSPAGALGTNINCVSCVNATTRRLLGHDIEAAAEPARGYGGPNDLLPSVGGGFRPWATAADAEKQMLDAGEGAIGVVRIKQAGPFEHAINVVNRNGRVYFIDSQSGHIVKLKPDIIVKLGIR